MNKDVYRSPAVAGMFYPAEISVLNHDLDQLFEKIPPQVISGKIIGLVSPHAGYKYSGLTAAFAYKQIQAKEYQTVVVISPSHREYFDGISVYNGRGYSTPLGKLDIDLELKQKLLNFGKPIIESVQGHRSEHALEVQLPFLQKTLKNFTILPLVMGDQSPDLCTFLGESLAVSLEGREHVLIVASSDLSHFHNSEIAKKLDSVIIEDINRFDSERILKDLALKNTEACGGGPISAMLIAAKKMGAENSKVLRYSDSGDVTGDKTEVVGYLSAIVWKSN